MLTPFLRRAAAPALRTVSFCVLLFSATRVAPGV